jgi:hypothetical protein
MSRTYKDAKDTDEMSVIDCLGKAVRVGPKDRDGVKEMQSLMVFHPELDHSRHSMEGLLSGARGIKPENPRDSFTVLAIHGVIPMGMSRLDELIKFHTQQGNEATVGQLEIGKKEITNAIKAERELAVKKVRDNEIKKAHDHVVAPISPVSVGVRHVAPKSTGPRVQTAAP